MKEFEQGLHKISKGGWFLFISDDNGGTEEEKSEGFSSQHGAGQ